jgi:hypothetical protein
MQARTISRGRATSSLETADPTRSVRLLGEPTTWVRRHLAVLAVAEVVVHLCGRLPGALAYAVACLLALNHQMMWDLAWGRSGTVGRAGRRAAARPGPSPVFLVLSMVALARIASLATSGFSATWFGGYAVAGLPIGLALWRWSLLSGTRPLRDWGDPSWRQACVACAAIPLAFAGVLGSRPRPVLDWWDLSWQFCGMVVLFAASGVLDEILYQAVLRPAMGAVMGTSGAAGCAFLYAITHGDVGLSLLGAMVAANVVFRVAVQRTGVLVGACTGRALFNVLAVFALPYWLPH